MPKVKAKAKPFAKRVNCGKCSSEEQDVKELTDKPRAFVAFGKFFFFFTWQNGAFSVFFGPLFRFLYPRTFFCFWFFHRSLCKELPRTCRNFCQVCDVNKNMQMTWNTIDERLLWKFSQESHPLTRIWHLRSLLTLVENVMFFWNNSVAFWHFQCFSFGNTR